MARGSASVQKAFVLTVPPLNQMDDEAVRAAMQWLSISRTLGENLSALSVKENLSLPDSGPGGVAVTWASDMPEVISGGGDVNRPAVGEGNKKVTLTATFAKGVTEESQTYVYSVFALPDTTPPHMKKVYVSAGDIGTCFYLERTGILYGTYPCRSLQGSGWIGQ